jgi:hypothetical protein
MPHCHNCGYGLQGEMKFCPACGQEQSAVVSHEDRIPTQQNAPLSPPPFQTGDFPGTSHPPAGFRQPTMMDTNVVGLRAVATVADWVLLAIVFFAEMFLLSGLSAAFAGPGESVLDTLFQAFFMIAACISFLPTT